MNQIINMILRTIMRRAINTGVNKGINAASGLSRRRGRNQPPPAVDDYGNVRGEPRRFGAPPPEQDDEARRKAILVDNPARLYGF